MKRTGLLQVAVLACLACVPVLASPANTLDRLPVQHMGRVKPLDTFARINLLAFQGKRSVGDISATEWLLDVLLSPEGTTTWQVFKVRNPEVATSLGLPRRESRAYSFSEVAHAIRDKEAMLQSLLSRDEGDLSPVESQMLELYRNLLRHQEISRSVSCLLPLFAVRDPELAAGLGLVPGKPTTYRQIISRSAQIDEALKLVDLADHGDWTESQRELLGLVDQLNRVAQDRYSTLFRVVPPVEGGETPEWIAPWELVGGQRNDPRHETLLDAWERFLAARLTSRRAEEERAAGAIKAAMIALSPEAAHWSLPLEAWYNRADLFYKSVALYILSFLLLGSSWLLRPRWLRRASLLALCAGIGIHGAGLLLRMLIMGRAPVSTLYESIVFVGLAGALSGIVVELMRRDGMGILLGAVAGAVLHFLGFAHAADGDTMGMLVAVLNSNFWLSTHVVTITIGYGCSLVAGLAGHLYLLNEAVRPSGTERLESLDKSMLGLCLTALFFTLLGTILGGIWADQSWGRFWGWDPKENGALLIVLWQLMLLHGRRTGLFGPRSFAAGLVVNNVVVAIAWFGVNLLNVGLHSYGTTGNIALNLALFCALELLFAISVSLLAFFRGRTMQPS